MTDTAPNDVLKGALFMILSAAFFAATHTAVRQVSETIHPFEAALARNIFGIALLAPVLMRSRFRPLYTKRIRLHAFRGLINSGFMLGFFMSLSLIPVAQATALNFTAPLFTTLLAILILGERVGWRRWSALFLGFAGALIILRPGIEGINLGGLLVIFASICWGGATICLKKLSATESSLTSTAYLMIFVLPITLIAAIPFWKWPSWEEAGWLVAVAALATIAQLALSEAIKWADTSAVTPFDFTRLLFAAILGWALFRELPDFWVWIGAGVLVVSGTFIIRREGDKAAPPEPSG